MDHKHMTKEGVVKNNPLGKKISQDRYYYYLEVLPPLIQGRSQVIKFLDGLDNNPELSKKLKRPDVVGAFMQGEGGDNHDIYARTNDSYYKVGRTRYKWNTEMFRYEDWNTMTPDEILRYNDYLLTDEQRRFIKW